MFERFTAEARRVVFHARYEANRFGSPEVTAEHLLLGCLKEAHGLLSPAARDSIRSQIELKVPKAEKRATTADVPLSHPSKRVMAYCAEESERLGHQHIGVEHLVLGLMREEKTLAADLLQKHGLTVASLRERLQRQSTAATVSWEPPQTSDAADICRDLTAAATNSAFPPLIGRESELANVIQVLGRRYGNNPVLVGEPGVGKTAIVESLAQRIADGQVPEFLMRKRILALNPLNFVDAQKARREFQRKFADLIATVADLSDVILFIDGLFEPGVRTGSPFGDVLGPLLASLSFSQCIATGTPAGYREAVERDPVVERYFRAVQIVPPGEKDAILILQAVKAQYEEFHQVTYDDAAVESAVVASVQFMPRRHLPEKAIDLLDEAGSRVKLRREKSKTDDVSQRAVTQADIDELVAERTGLPVERVKQRLYKK